MPALISWWTLDVRTLAPEAHADAVARTGAELLRRWSDPARRYHGTTHLVEMFWALEDLEAAGEIDDQAGVPRPAGGVVPRRGVRRPRPAGRERGGQRGVRR